MVSVIRPLARVQGDYYHIIAIEINKSVSQPSLQQWLFEIKGTSIIDLKFVNSNTISFNLVEYNEKLDKNIKTNRKVNLYRNVADSFKRQKDYFVKKRCFIVGWDFAQKILLKNKLVGGKQYHTGWVTFEMERDGRRYLTKPPKIDYIFEFFKKNNISTKGFASE